MPIAPGQAFSASVLLAKTDRARLRSRLHFTKLFVIYIFLIGQPAPLPPQPAIVTVLDCAPPGIDSSTLPPCRFNLTAGGPAHGSVTLHARRISNSPNCDPTGDVEAR